jgi:hypothetical protein
MARSSSAGGGINSKQVRQVGQRLGQPAEGRGIGRVAQIGNKVGDHTTEGKKSTGYRGDPMFMKAPTGGAQRLGNEIALNSKSAPGQGRQIHPTGGQGVHGPIDPGNRPTPTGRDPLAPWFPPSPARQSPIKK